LKNISITKGDICLANLGKSRDSFAFGKSRPVLVFQTNKLNYAVEEGIYGYFLVIPLSTQNDIVTEEFRYHIEPRERLLKKSYAVCNSICFLSRSMIGEKLASLTHKEIRDVELVLRDLFDMETHIR
jgi:mRNA-degrading endonuclease toxin of MazEF toxin-antitoxin module